MKMDVYTKNYEKDLDVCQKYQMYYLVYDNNFW